MLSSKPILNPPKIMDIEDITDTYKLDEIVSSFYKLQDIEKINYAQYLPPNQDDQWSVQMELKLRKDNPKNLVALLSRELWCFSINDNPLPKLPTKLDEPNQASLENSPNNSPNLNNNNNNNNNNEIIPPNKSGEFNSDYSKPNLPPHYALFLKALRRAIYINLAVNSNNQMIQYGNACISLIDNVTINNNTTGGNTFYESNKNNNNPIIQLEPHLFANGVLAVSVCVKDLGLIRLKEEKLQDEEFLLTHPLYLAPSGIRMSIISEEQSSSSVSSPSFSKTPQFCPPPPNADFLLTTLKISHGITLKDKNEIKWIKVIPNLDHLNGNTPSIANYNKLPTNNERKIIWPLDLCFVQVQNNQSGQQINTNTMTSLTAPAEDIDMKSNEIDPFAFTSLHEVMNTIDDFIQIRQTSALRTPGSSGAVNTNPMSTGSAYTEQFQQYYKNTTNATSQQPLGSKVSPFNPNSHVSPSLSSSIDKNLTIGNEPFNSEFSMTPTMAPNINNELFSIGKVKPHSDNPLLSPLKNEQERRINLDSMDLNQVSHETPKDKIQNDNIDIIPKPSQPMLHTASSTGDDKDLFGDDDEDEDQKPIIPGNKISDMEIDESDKIINHEPSFEEEDDLFGEMNDSSVEEKKNLSGKGTSDEITEDMFEMSDDEDSVRQSNKPMSENNMDSVSSLGNTPKDKFKKPNLKRKYLDIPLEEITLSNSPLYTDPGAPLPVETPKDKRKSVFAPLTFNPIIENNVDNKYKNGGKFSFSPTQKEEALNFDISTGNISSSDDDESDSSFESVEYNNIKQDLKLFDGSVHDTQFLNYQPIQGVQDSVPPSFMSNGYPLSGESYAKDTANSIWKMTHSTNEQNLSPLKSTDPTFSIQSSGLTEHKIKEDNKEIIPPLIEHNNGSHLNQSSVEFSQDSQLFNNLPFLLRHIPLSSIPDVYLAANPRIEINPENEDILNVLCEQVVYDNNLLNNLQIPEVRYNEIIVKPNSFISDTMQKLFPDFISMNGNELINKIFRMKQPFVFVKKQHEIIKIKSDAQPFGKFLNLKPAMGIKNFKFLLLTDSSGSDYDMFISTLSQTYTNHEFGFCELLKLTPGDKSGLISLKSFEENKLLLLAAQIVSYCSTSKNSGKDTTLMIILPLQKNTISCLLSNVNVFRVIRDEVRSKIPNMDLLLKVVPESFIKNPLTSVDDYYNLCVGIYNILWPKETKFTTVAHKLPSNISFRTLQNGNGLTTINYDSYIHMAYSRSVDKQWVFCALSDSDGKTNMVKSWFVGNSKQKFDDACTQLWTMALSLACKKYGKICLILTRLNGILPDDELVNWRRLSGRSIHLAVVCVDDNTKVSFSDGDRMYPSFKPLVRDPKIFEPINYSQLDNYEIVNIDDDIHGIIFQDPFPLANSQHRCAIKTGALIKFKQTRNGMIWDKLEVNLLNCPHSDSTKLLEIILEEFRSLAALSIWFGVSDGENSHIPWHVLAVKKMMKSLIHVQVDVKEFPSSK